MKKLIKETILSFQYCRCKSNFIKYLVRIGIRNDLKARNTFLDMHFRRGYKMAVLYFINIIRYSQNDFDIFKSLMKSNYSDMTSLFRNGDFTKSLAVKTMIKGAMAAEMDMRKCKFFFGLKELNLSLINLYC